jgi:hypothetical protein
VNSASEGIDYFISYTSADTPWAEWIAWTLERDGGYTVSFQPWDFLPGTNFPLKMQEAAAHSKRTIAVLSPAYLEANFTGAEWVAAFVRDPKGIHRRLIPVMVETCEPDGLLASIVSIRLMGLDEAGARETLLRGASDNPRSARLPTFPGGIQVTRPETRSSHSQVSPAFPAALHKAPADKPSPAAEYTAPVPWTPLTTDLPAPWEKAGPLGASAPAGDRLELHLLPVVTDSVPDLPRLPVARLVDAGREAGLFPTSATVTTETSKDHVAALLAGTAGLRVTGDGMRSCWLTLPPTGESGLPTAVVDGIARLVAVTATLRPALKGRVAFSVAIFTARGTARILPPGATLPSRYLASHCRQVAAELAAQFNALGP